MLQKFDASAEEGRFFGANSGHPLRCSAGGVLVRGRREGDRSVSATVSPGVACRGALLCRLLRLFDLGSQGSPTSPAAAAERITPAAAAETLLPWKTHNASQLGHTKKPSGTTAPQHGALRLVTWG